MPSKANYNLVSEISALTGLSDHEVRKIMYIIGQAMIKALRRGDYVQIKGFGTFSLVTYKAVKIHTPLMPKVIKVPRRKKVKFKPGTYVNYLVNDAYLGKADEFTPLNPTYAYKCYEYIREKDKENV